MKNTPTLHTDHLTLDRFTLEDVPAVRDTLYTQAVCRNLFITPGKTTEETKTVHAGIVSAISSAVIDGNTNYYIMLEGKETIFVVPASMNNKLPFLKVGDRIAITEVAGVYKHVNIS